MRFFVYAREGEVEDWARSALVIYICMVPDVFISLSLCSSFSLVLLIISTQSQYSEQGPHFLPSSSPNSSTHLRSSLLSLKNPHR